MPTPNTTLKFKYGASQNKNRANYMRSKARAANTLKNAAAKTLKNTAKTIHPRGKSRKQTRRN